MTEIPRLAVFHDAVSASFFEVLEGTRDVCKIIWVVGWSQHDLPRKGLTRFGEVCELADADESEYVERIAATEPDGVIVFSDAPLLFAAAAAVRLGLPFHSPEAALLLYDKFAQRGALQRGDLPVPAYAAVKSGDFPPDFPFPAVLKPRAGAGSRDTYRIESEAELASIWAKCDPDEAFILEEFLVDRSTEPGLGADQISVESIVRDGDITHVTTTGRFPLATPFRETGAYLPSDLSPTDQQAVFDVASRTLKALGVRHGIVHTEIKMTPKGPRIIEVNGRIGGHISGLVSRLGGPSMFVIAVKLALGLDIGAIPDISDSPVGFYRLLVAPPAAIEVTAIEGLDMLENTPGIDGIRVNRQPGDSLDFRESSQVNYIVRIDGLVESHDELNKLVHERVPSTVSLTYVEDTEADSNHLSSP